jgi:tetratricopeptide (TPR) repeat protein
MAQYGTVFAKQAGLEEKMKLVVYLFATLVVAALLAPPLARGQASAQSEAESIFIEAQKALARGDQDTAESLLLEALVKNPSFTSAVWQLAQVYEHEGRLDTARELYLRGLSQDPQASWARDKVARIDGTLSKQLLAQAKSSFEDGNFSQAIHVLSTYLGMKPDDGDALVLMAKSQLGQGNVGDARKNLQKALARDPGDKEATAVMGTIEKRDRKERVEQLITNAQVILLRLSPANSDSARAALSKVLDADPSNAWAKGQIDDVNRFLTERKEANNPHSAAKRNVVVAKSEEALGETQGILARMGALCLKHLTLVVLVAALVLLAVDLRRRLTRRSYPLAGTINLIPILDVVSLINANLRSGMLIVVGPRYNGQIYFEKGEIIHARIGKLEGKRAFHELMKLRTGRYFFHSQLPKVRRTITDPLSLLLLSMRPGEEPIVDLEHEIKPEESLARSR